MTMQTGLGREAAPNSDIHARPPWAFWKLDLRARAYLFGAESAAAGLTGVALIAGTLSVATTARFLVLMALALGYAEGADRIERFKRYLGSDRMWSNHTSIWAVAAVLTLPTGPAALLVVAVYGHVFALGHRHRSVRPHRLLLTAAAMVLATLAASTLGAVLDKAMALPDGPQDAVIAACAATLFLLVDLTVMVCGMYLATGVRRLSAVLPSRDTVGFEVVTLLLGVVVAQFVLNSVWLAPVPLVLVGVLHRSSLVKELEQAATTDSKTELLNAGTWRDRAGQALSRVTREGGEAALFLIDLDHFKLVNDTHGHLVGDQVLRQVADCLRQQSRSHDLLGRFGGEEFVVFIDGATAAQRATDTANRLRACIAALDLPHGIELTVSIGVAVSFAAQPQSVDDMLGQSDRALYAAKAAGRDCVRSARLLSRSPD